MNYILKIFFVFLFLSYNAIGQDVITVDGLTEGKQWQIIEKAISDNGYEISKFLPDKNVIYTNWITWNSLTIQNRGLIEVKLNGNKATISMVQRAYKSTNGWTDSFGKLSKKNRKKFLQTLADKMLDINTVGASSAQAVLDSELFPAFKPVNNVLGMEFILTSVSQDIGAENKAITLSFNVKNTTSKTVKLELNLWGAKEIFKGSPGTIKNFIPGKRVGGERFHKEFKPGESDTFSAHYKCSDIIKKIPKYSQYTHVSGKREFLVIHDIILPYGNIDVVIPTSEEIKVEIENVSDKEVPNGIYDNIAFVKTGDPKTQLMAVHEDGSMIGFQLDENRKQVRSLTFKKDLDSPEFVLLLDEEGNPKGGGFGDHVYVFQKIEGDDYNAITFDKDGNRLNETKIKLASSPKFEQLIEPVNRDKGPNVGFDSFHINAEGGLLEWLQQQTRALNVLGCAVSIPSGLGAIGPCGTLLIDEVLRVLPEDHIYYDELVLAKELLSIATFASPAGFLEKLTTITAAMATSVGTIEELVDKYYPDVTLNEFKPFISTSEEDYKRVDGSAVVHINYSKFLSEKEKTILVYKVEADNTLTFFTGFDIDKNNGELAFEIYFNGNYEVQALFDNEIKNKIFFKVSGSDSGSNSKFKNYKCMNLTFSAGIHSKWYNPNKQPEPETTGILPFDIDYWTCVDSQKSDYHLKPLNISWAGNNFMATATRKFSFSNVTYQIQGEISSDGRMLKNVFIKVTSIWVKDHDKSVEKEVKDVWLGNIPYDPKKKMFVSYKNKYGSIPNASSAIKALKYKKTTTYPGNIENNYLVKYVPKDGFKTAKEGNFSFKLGFTKPK